MISEESNQTFKSLMATASFSITAGSYKGITVDFSSVIPNGYYLMAINTISFAAAYSEYLVLSSFTISNSTKGINLNIRSLASSSTISGTVDVWAVCAPNYST